MAFHWQKLKRGYLNLWDQTEGWKRFAFYLFHYTLLFILLQRWVFSDFYEVGKSFVCDVDGMAKYFPDAVYFSQTIRDGLQSILKGEGWTIPLYDFRRGVVKPNLEIEPVMWLSVLCPWDKIDIFFDFLILCRIYLTGVAFSILGFYFGFAPFSVLVGAVSYSFCGNSIYTCMRGAPFFWEAMIIFPLLIVGAEKLLRGEKAWIFTAMVAVAVLSSIFYSCIMAILIVIYIFGRYFCAYSRNGISGFGQVIIRMAMFGGIGVLLGGITAIPMLIQMFGTGRVGRYIEMQLQYQPDYYQSFLTHFLVKMDWITSDGSLGFSVLAVPSLFLLFTKRNAGRTLKAMFIGSTAMLLIPAVSYMFSGFNTINHRWGFAYALCVCAVIMFGVSELENADRKRLAITGLGSLSYILICYFFIERRNYSEEPQVLLLLALLMFAMCFSAGTQGKIMAMVLCLALTCFSAYYGAFMRYDITRGGFIKTFIDKGTQYDIMSRGQYASLGCSGAVQNDDSFFRVDGSDISWNDMETAFYYNVNGMSYYSSRYFRPYKDMQNVLEVPQRRMGNANYGIGARGTVLSLNSVKYYAARENTNAVWPYGFEEVERVKNKENTDVILENKYALPVGYTYGSWMEEKEFLRLSALEQQEALLQAAVLKSEPIQKDIPKEKVETTGKRIPARIVDMDGATWENGVLKVEKADATITLRFHGAAEGNAYLRIVNLKMESGAYDVIVYTGNSVNQARFNAETDIYTNEAKTQLLYLGSFSEGYTTCTLTFPQEKTFTLEDLEIWYQPMDRYAEQIDALRAESLENVKTNWRGLAGTISTSKDKFLCFSIPYDEGWTAYVDGEKMDLVQANIGFMGVELPAGDHNIELKYWPPGLTVGIALSCTGVIGIVALVLWEKKKRKI